MLPIALCIEDLHSAIASERHLRCVALPGRQAGLRLDAAGAVTWLRDEEAACVLCVSLDGRLALVRPQGAAPVTVRRYGRSLEVPFDKPVMLLDQDQLEVGARRLRLHVHGPASAVSAPAFVAQRGSALARAAAAALVVGTALSGGGGAEAQQEPQDGGADGSGQVAPADAGGPTDASAYEEAPIPRPIEVREIPPVPPPPQGGCAGRRRS